VKIAIFNKQFTVCVHHNLLCLHLELATHTFSDLLTFDFSYLNSSALHRRSCLISSVINDQVALNRCPTYKLVDLVSVELVVISF
jgi:hypothetical protein